MTSGWLCGCDACDSVYAFGDDFMLGGIMMHYRAPERPPPFATGFMAAVEASCGTDGRCRSASPCAMAWASTPLVR